MSATGLPLADQLRAVTRQLHVRAERSGFIHDLLSGSATRDGYALLLRNLLPVYSALEAGLERHRESPGIGLVAHRSVYRSSSLATDLEQLAGADWANDLPQLRSGYRYADRVSAAAEGRGVGLIGHAYVRYLGDMNGGLVVKRRLSETLDLPAEALSFYAYPEIDDLEQFRSEYRGGLDRAADPSDHELVVEHALDGFRFNIELSEEVRRFAAQ